MQEKILGLDIGISSVGWAVVEYDKETTKNNNLSNNKIIDSGVRIFTRAENPKTGESLALPRREARSARRTIKRKAKRLKAIKNLFINYLDISTDDLFSESNIYNQAKQRDVWQLRDKALVRLLTDKELARVLTHIAKRRGYKSNRKAEESGSTEGKKVLTAIENNKQYLVKHQTIGQYLYQENKDSHIRRNKKDDYKNSISRELLKDEIKIILQKQQDFGNSKITIEFIQKYLELFNKQIDFASVDKMVGTCTLEGKNEKRAAKRTCSAEEFVTLTKLINTKIIDADGIERIMSEDELTKALDLCKTSQNPSYLKLKEVLKLKEDESFKNIEYYEIDKKTGEITKKITKFSSGFIGFHILRKIVEKVLSKEQWQQLSQDINLLNNIATIFSYHKNDEKINEELQLLDFSSLNSDEKQILIKALIEDKNIDAKFKHFLNLSIKAITKLLPHIKTGKRYDEAVELVGYKKQNTTKKKLLRALNTDEMQEITNPVVKRALAQTRKVVNALIRKYGSFDKVHIELTRDIKKPYKDRKAIERGQQEYQNIKQSIVDNFYENYNRYPQGKELLKFRLWQEQDGYCAYSMQYIKPEQLLEQGLTEIDHILPFSRSLEDGMHNKVLCLTKENQNKKNQTPYEYFKNIDRDWGKYEVWVKSLKIKKAKRIRLLKKNFDENSEKEFRERNANDTAYMARFIKNFIENNLELTSEDKQKVFVRNGSLTSLLRHSWGLSNKDRDTHLHHAEDAIILALSTQSEVQRLSSFSANKVGFIYEKSKDKAQKLKFTPPIENIRDKVQKSTDNIFVSFAPRKNISGEAHEKTIYSPKTYIANKKTKPTHLSGGSVIRNVKLNNKQKLAKQSSMPRIDIFQNVKTKKYYIVPIYTIDFAKNTLPNKAIVSGKNKDGSPKEWMEMNENYQFLFSVYKNELLEIKTKKECLKGYFVSAHSGTAAVEIKSHNNTEQNGLFVRNSSNVCSRSIGIQNAEYIKKYQVDPLGNITEIKSEKRIGTKQQNKKK
jgi:CRISPR-associated endonuclease Csn1